MNRPNVRWLREPFLAAALALPVAALALVPLREASATTGINIRNPLWSASKITSEWNHPDSPPPPTLPYPERSLDLVYDQGRSVTNASVSSRLENLNSGANVYYDSFDYGTSCNGVKHVIYENPSGTGMYNFVGTAVYLHMYGYSTSWYSVTIPASSSEARTVGWVSSGTCGTGAHLHHGRTTNQGGALGHASWLNSGIGLGDNYDVTSDDITLYK